MSNGRVFTIRKNVWTNIVFFGFTTLMTFTGLPLYIYHVGLSAADWALFGFMCVATMLATTFGYHRLFAHRSFGTHPFIKFLCLFFGAASFQSSALNWSSMHRDHHKYTDTDRDPYNIKHGFLFAQMGWFLFYDHVRDYNNARDLTKSRMFQHQHDHWLVWAIAAGWLLPLAIGAMTGHFWGAFFFGVCGRFFIIHQSVFCINSACHTLGKRTYNVNGSPTDSWICALLTNGEGYHSFHHRFPSDYRNGIRWYHWDPTKWITFLFQKVGLTWNLNCTPDHQILAARSLAEKEGLFQKILDCQSPKIKDAMSRLNVVYDGLKVSLKQWETKAFEYRRLKGTESREIYKQALKQMRAAKEQFLKAREQWLFAIRHHELVLNLP